MITICIDCGASFIKAASFTDGRMLELRQARAPGIQEEGRILSPDRIQSLVGLVRDAIVQLAAGREARLCISNEMHGFVLADSRGEAYTDHISWQTELGNIRIGGRTSKELLCEPRWQENIRRTGMPVRAGLASANLYYFSRIGKLPEKGACFYTLGDYIIRALSGKEPVCHPTNAAATGLFDIYEMDWDRRLIAGIGAGDVHFPRTGEAQVEFELNGVRLHCMAAIGDQQAALLGAGFTKERTLSFNLGTGAQASLLVRGSEQVEGCQCRPYFYGCYLRTIPHIPCGRALNVYFRFVESILREYGCRLQDEDIWEGILRASERGGTGGLKLDLGFFENAVNGSTQGEIGGITENNLAMDGLFSAFCQQLAQNCVRMADRLEGDRAKVQGIVFSGGVARRFAAVRESILAHYPQVEADVSEQDTLYGLYQYSRMQALENGRRRWNEDANRRK